MARTSLLQVADLHVSYGPVRALRGVSVEVREGEVVALIGANGAGKSTLLQTVVGLSRPSAGTVHYGGRDITRLAVNRVVALGVALVPEGRGVLPQMTVMDNLLLGSHHLRGPTDKRLATMYERFPVLGRRSKQVAGSLSGGEQQMLVIARALMGSPRLLMLDEPSIGLSPLVVSDVFKLVDELRTEGYSILLAEQNARKALQYADRAYVFETGRVVLEGLPEDLACDSRVQDAYLGGG